MVMKLFILMTVFCALSANIFALSPVQLPNQFTVTERWLSWTSTFDIESQQYKLGTVHRKFFSWTLEYDFYDIYDQLQATAKRRFLSFGATFDVNDDLGQPIGRVEERIFRFFPTFDIYSPMNELLATAKMNFWGTTYTLYDPVTNEEIATLSRPFFSFRDSWTTDINDLDLFYRKRIDPRLFILVMAFQTDRDNWQRQRQQEEWERENQFRWNYSANVKKLNAKITPEQSVATLAVNFDELSKEIEPFRSQLDGIEPTEQDFDSVNTIIEEKLGNEQSSENSTEKARIANGLKRLIPFLKSNEMSPSEKSALFLMMDKHFNLMK